LANLFIAAGGSGGHIFPGISLAQALKKEDPQIDIFFWGNKNSMESRIVPQHGFSIKTVSIGRLNHNVSLFERLWTVVQLPLAFLKAFFVLIYYRPRLVIGMGGHASAPLLLAASLLRIKSYLWEPNAYPGMANRYLSKVVDECLTVFKEAQKYFPDKKSKSAGMLVRDDIDQLFNVEKTFDQGQKLKLFVFGGSQGAQGINKIVSECFIAHKELLDKIEVFHQTGPNSLEPITSLYKKKALNIKTSAFVEDMKEKYIWADFSICRGGINSLTELAAAGLPPLVIPLSTAANDHQQKNAQALVDMNAAFMEKQSDLSVDKLYKILLTLAEDKSPLESYSQNIKNFYKPGYSRQLAKYLLEKNT